MLWVVCCDWRIKYRTECVCGGEEGGNRLLGFRERDSSRREYTMKCTYEIIFICFSFQCFKPFFQHTVAVVVFFCMLNVLYIAVFCSLFRLCSSFRLFFFSSDFGLAFSYTYNFSIPSFALMPYTERNQIPFFIRSRFSLIVLCLPRLRQYRVYKRHGLFTSIHMWKTNDMTPQHFRTLCFLLLLVFMLLQSQSPLYSCIERHVFRLCDEISQ